MRFYSFIFFVKKKKFVSSLAAESQASTSKARPEPGAKAAQSLAAWLIRCELPAGQPKQLSALVSNQIMLLSFERGRVSGQARAHQKFRG
jgi:hypothetical protein